MLIGADDIDRIEVTYRNLWIQGMRIISTDSSAAIHNSPIIKMV